MKAIVWVLLVLVAGMVGCTHPEAFIQTQLLVDGREVAGGATLHGKGYSVNAEGLLNELGGSVDVISDGTVIITLAGKRFLLSAVSRDVNYDVHVRGGVQWSRGELQLYNSQVELIIREAYPGGRAFREGGIVHIETSRR